MIGGKPVVEARVGLLPAESGGLHDPMPTGTRSLMLVFPSLEDPASEVKIGAVIEVIGGPSLGPGPGGGAVLMPVLGERAAVYAAPCAAVQPRYCRPLRAGVVERGRGRGA